MDTSVVLALSVSCGALKPASEGSLQPPEEGACVLLKMVFEKPENAKVCPKKLKGNQEIHHLFKKLLLCVYMCLCVHVCTCLHAQEVPVECLSQLLSALFFGNRSLMEPGAH